MKSVADWKALLRGELKKALVARETHLSAVLRETLAAIDNAEAPPASDAPAARPSGTFAGSVGGLGSGEIPRLRLSPETVTAIVENEIRDRERAAAEYQSLGRDEESAALLRQSDFLRQLKSQ